MSSPVKLFGQNLDKILVSSAGGILTSQTPELKNDKDHLELPNHIAPFLCSLPPDVENDQVYYREDPDQEVFIAQWSRHVNPDHLEELKFQAQVFKNGTVIFVYKSFSVDAIHYIVKAAYPYIIGLQSGFTNINQDQGRVI